MNAANFQVVPGGLAAAAGRTLPHSTEAEEYLLSCCMLDGAAVVGRCLAARLCADSFYEIKHGIVFACILDLYERQIVIDVAVVAEELKTAGKLDAIGGYAFLAGVSGRIPTTAQASYFVEKVREQWILRQLIRQGTKLVEGCYGFSGGPLVDFLSPHVVWFEAAMARLAHGGSGQVVTVEHRIGEMVADMRARAAGQEDRSRWVYTGFRAFDDLDHLGDRALRPFNSLDEDGFVLVGGGSSDGKSVVMRQWAGEALRRGQTVLVYSLETSVKGFCRSLAANWAGVNLLAFNRTPADLQEKFYSYCAELRALADKRLFIFQNEPATPLDTVEQFALHARRFTQQHGTPHLIVMDYLQRLDTSKRYGNAEQRVATVSKTTQSLQRELGNCIVGGAQFNESALAAMRTPKHDEEGRLIHTASMPTRGALRESQALYHDCDVANFLYRPPENCAGASQVERSIPTPEMWIVQDKRRNGTPGICRCIFERRFGRYREFSAEENHAAEKPLLALPPGQRVAKADFKSRRA